MKEVHEVAALSAKALFDLVRYPGCSITHTMDTVAFAKACTLGAGA